MSFLTPLLFTVALAAPPITAEVQEEDLAEQVRTLRAELETTRTELKELHEESSVAKDLSGFGSKVVVGANQTVQEAVSFGDDVIVSGIVEGDAVSFGGDVLVRAGGKVIGDAVAFGGKVVAEPGASIGGDRVTMGVPSFSTSPPKPHQSSISPPKTSSWSVGSAVSAVYNRLVFLLSVAGAGVLLVGLFPNRIGRIALNVEAHPIRSTLVGGLAFGFFSLFALLFTVLTLGLGLPVSFLVAVGLGVAWMFGFLALCQAVGDRLPFKEKLHGRWASLLVGAVILAFFGSLPWVFFLAVIMASMLGIGAALSTRFGSV